MDYGCPALSQGVLLPPAVMRALESVDFSDSQNEPPLLHKSGKQALSTARLVPLPARPPVSASPELAPERELWEQRTGDYWMPQKPRRFYDGLGTKSIRPVRQIQGDKRVGSYTASLSPSRSQTQVSEPPLGGRGISQPPLRMHTESAHSLDTLRSQEDYVDQSFTEADLVKFNQEVGVAVPPRDLQTPVGAGSLDQAAPSPKPGKLQSTFESRRHSPKPPPGQPPAAAPHRTLTEKEKLRNTEMGSSMVGRGWKKAVPKPKGSSTLAKNVYAAPVVPGMPSGRQRSRRPRRQHAGAMLPLPEDRQPILQDYHPEPEPMDQIASPRVPRQPQAPPPGKMPVRRQFSNMQRSSEDLNKAAKVDRANSSSSASTAWSQVNCFDEETPEEAALSQVGNEAASNVILEATRTPEESSNTLELSATRASDEPEPDEDSIDAGGMISWMLASSLDDLVDEDDDHLDALLVLPPGEFDSEAED
eukprot:TRINITY_DN9259_c0_g1_i1.p1 TRINITY_DN9259_c0_g1~~TRINITY_DN9259_c0_g1_i1.p1  ORF type:complete len:476 (-),score=111.87 TRINITY_DN9259_c0_g1_i1:324-1751(-)